MKKIILIILALSSLLLAEVAKVVAIKGKAIIQRGDKNIPLTLDSTLNTNDIIKTLQDSKLQIIFKDETIITIGKNSTFEVNDYLFDEKSNKYKAEFGLIKGTFRTITGKIGKIAPDKFTLKSKSSSIGIRGTQILSNVQISGDTIFCTEGSITITSNLTGETITIHAGEFVIIRKEEEIVVGKFDINIIQETDTNTKFLIDEDKASALEEFGVIITDFAINPVDINTPTPSENYSSQINDHSTYDSVNAIIIEEESLREEQSP